MFCIAYYIKISYTFPNSNLFIMGIATDVVNILAPIVDRRRAVVLTNTSTCLITLFYRMFPVFVLCW